MEGLVVQPQFQEEFEGLSLSLQKQFVKQLVNDREFWEDILLVARRHAELPVEQLLDNPEFLEDVLDLVILYHRRGEPSRPLDEYLAERGLSGGG